MATSKENDAVRKAALQRHVRTYWRLVFIGIGLVCLLFLLASFGLFGELPDHTKLENPDSELATEIVSADGVVMGKYYSENRTPIQFEDLPQNIVDALVATEDERFYSHSGIDARGTLRAFRHLGAKGGASTITQQLAKNYFTGERSKNKLQRGLQKIQEWIIAVRLERQYTKNEIIAMYLNQIDFLYYGDGIKSAANIYFDKDPKDLNIQESAVFVAMLKNPRQFNPKREVSKEKALGRRNQVFVQMVRNGMLTESQKDSLTQLPIELNYSPESHTDGMATYFREHLRGWLKSWASKNTNPATGNAYSLYSDGLKVNVTIDSRMQLIAEQATAAHMTNLQKEFDRQNRNNRNAPFRDISKSETESILNTAMRRSERYRLLKAAGKTDDQISKSFDTKTDMVVFDWKSPGQEVDTIMTPRDSVLYYKKFLQAGMMSMEPQTGYVKAWVGGINQKHFQYDHVTGKRQPGSTFKPFVYATAIDLLHFSPCKTYSSSKITIPAGRHGAAKSWTPSNSGGGYNSTMTLMGALANSVNTISAKLINETGPQAVVDLTERLGVDTSDFDIVPSLALGTPAVSVYEMVGAYSVFANGGIFIEPVLVTSIEDKNGRVVYQQIPETKDVLNPETAYVTVKLMEGVTSDGSGKRLRGSSARNDYYYKTVVTGYPYNFDNDIAGKTGTTQNNSDGWFMGMVPNLVTGVWVGGENRSVHFGSTLYGQGATMALPIWGSYMKGIYAIKELGISKDSFKKPEDLSIEIDCTKYKDAGSGGSGFSGYGDESGDGDELEM